MTTQHPAASLPGQVMDAWRDQDARAFADTFVEDGTMMIPGQYVTGRENIAAFMAAAFQGPYKDTRVVGAPIDVKVLADGVVVLVTEGGVIPAGEDSLPERAEVRATWVATDADGAWRLAVYQNSPAHVPVPA